MCSRVAMSRFAFQVIMVALAFVLQGVWPLPHSLIDRGIDLGLGGSQWVDIWTAMPQLTEPANLPPVPFVRLTCFSLIVSLCLLTTIPEPE